MTLSELLHAIGEGLALAALFGVLLAWFVILGA